MIKIAVASYDNVAPVAPMSAVFGKERKTLGRSNKNFFVLPDPKHEVSRSQAAIWSDGKRHILINLSRASPLTINGKEAKTGAEIQIKAGDQIQVGLYVLRAEKYDAADAAAQATLATPADVEPAPAGPDQLVQVETKSAAAPVEAQEMPAAVAAHEEPAPVEAHEESAAIEAQGLPTPVDAREEPAPVEAHEEPAVIEAQGVPAALEAEEMQELVAAQEASASRAQEDLAPPEVQDVPVPMAAQDVPAPVPAQETPAPAMAHGAGNIEELKAAFLRGAGIPAGAITAELTPEMMELMGKLLSSSLQGAIDLLAMRSLVKQEVKADLTMVVIRNNNPLKFFPDSQTVLTQMLRKKMPGFMEPFESVEDAFQDLRQHQTGVVAGMRATLNYMLQRLKPERFEAKLPKPTMMDSLIPSKREAAMWDMYVKKYGSIAGETRDEFKSLFGPAFLAAYEKEIERSSHGTPHG